MPGTEDDYAPLLEVPACAKRKVRLGDLAHRDCRLHSRVDARLLQEILQRKAVHDGAEHAHVVGARAIEATLLQFRSAEEVSAADDHGNLYAGSQRPRRSAQPPW